MRRIQLVKEIPPSTQAGFPISPIANMESSRSGCVVDPPRFSLKQIKFHGLHQVFSVHLSCPRRAFWLMAILASMALLLTWSSNRVHYLLSWPVHTKLHILYSPNLTFPAVTLCNNNLVLLRRMSRADLHLSGYWLGLLNKNLQPAPAVQTLLWDPQWLWLGNLLDFSHYLPPLPPQEQSTQRLLDRLGHQLEEMLLSCHFQGERCGPHNFTTVSQDGGKGTLGEDNRQLLGPALAKLLFQQTVDVLA